eukprot:gene12991-17420_t
MGQSKVKPDDLPPIATLKVKFINTPNGKDVIVDDVPFGSNLMAVGDKAGVVLPRACRTGLCGSCTCDLQDPIAIATSTNPRDGFATIRACSTKCFVPEGMDAMIIDVQRMRKRKPSKTPESAVPVAYNDDEDDNDPMARFSGNWEKDFKPLWELKADMRGIRASERPGLPTDPKTKTKYCQKCAATGRVICYACLGSGKISMSGYSDMQCSTCVGLRNIGCGYCRGTGIQNKVQK